MNFQFKLNNSVSVDAGNYLVTPFAFTVKSVEVLGFHSIRIELNNIIMNVAILKLQAEH